MEEKRATPAADKPAIEDKPATQPVQTETNPYKPLIALGDQLDNLTLLIQSAMKSVPVFTRDGNLLWLHVRVQVKWSLTQQQSFAWAWTSSDADGNKVTPVGRLDVSLHAHDKRTQSADAVGIVTTLEKSSIFGRPQRATATAIMKNPDFGPVSVIVEV